MVNLDDRFAPDWLATLTNRRVIRVSFKDADADCFAQDIQTSANSLEFAINLQGQAHLGITVRVLIRQIDSEGIQWDKRRR